MGAPMTMPKGANVPGPGERAAGRTGLAVRPRRARRGRLRAAAGGREGPLRRRLRLLQPAGAPLRRGAPRGEADRGRRGDRRPVRRPAARGARRSTRWCWPPPRTAAPSDACPGCASGCSTPASARRSPGSTAPTPRVETAFVLGEFYRRQGAWKFRAVGQGYDSGLAGLATDYGITVDEPRPAAPAAPRVQAPPPPAAPPPVTAPRQPAAPPAPVRLSKVTLTKDAPSVSLTKQGGTSRRPAREPQLAGAQAVLGVGQQAGPGRRDARRPRSRPVRAVRTRPTAAREWSRRSATPSAPLHQPPYIHLDGDDRTGAVDDRREPHHQPRPQAATSGAS